MDVIHHTIAEENVENSNLNTSAIDRGKSCIRSTVRYSQLLKLHFLFNQFILPKYRQIRNRDITVYTRNPVMH